jgi:hypothetical protein
MNSPQFPQTGTPAMVEAIANIPILQQGTVRKLKVGRSQRNTSAKEGTWLVFTFALGAGLLLVLPFVV